MLEALLNIIRFLLTLLPSLLVILLLFGAGMIGLILTIPIREGIRGQMMTALGLIISTAITLSSTCSSNNYQLSTVN